MLRLAIALAGTDAGKSGIGTYVRGILPTLATAKGSTLLAFGTSRDLNAYSRELSDARRSPLPDVLDKPGLSAAWHLARGGARAQSLHADVLLLPAANRRLTALGRIPTVQVVHDLAQFHVAGKYDAARTFYLKQLVVRALRTATVLVAVSEATARDLRDILGPHRPPIEVIPNGVDSQRFRPAVDGTDPRIVHATKTASISRPYVFYPARLEHPGKNHVRLLRAFAASRARDTHDLVLAGGDWGAKAMLEEEARTLGIAASVKLLGFVDDATLTGLVLGADAVAMLGLFEGFGLPALEALAAGRPVFCSSTGALPEVVSDLAAQCDPHDERDIGRALDRALYDEALRARARAEGPAHAAARDWRLTGEKLFALCRRTAGR